MRAAFDRRRQTIVRMLNDIHGVIPPEPLGHVYVYPSVKGVLGKEIAGKRPATTSSLPRCCWTRPRWRSCPAGIRYQRLLPAVLRRGHADVEEGVTRIGKFLAEAR